jgi:hypothetical protein
VIAHLNIVSMAMTTTMNEQNQQPVQGQIAAGADQLVIPNLFWAAVIFLALNILLLLWFTFSPKLSLGEQQAPREQTVAVADKPSPFTPVVDERRVAARKAEKVKPVVVATLNTLEETGVQAASWSTRPPQQQGETSYVRGNAVYEMMERQTEMPRLTAVNYPRSAERSVRHAGTQPVVR